MKIILRYIFKSILERRLRTVLILSAIMISSAMFFTSISISGTLVNMQMDAFRQDYGYTDIVIRSGADSPSRWFYLNKAEKYWTDAEYIIGEMSGYGTYFTGNGESGAKAGQAGKTGEAGQVGKTGQVENTGQGEKAGEAGKPGQAGKSGQAEKTMQAGKTGQVENTGQGEKAGTTLRGIDINELKKLTPFILESEKNLYPFKGMKAVISSDTARKYGLMCGSTMLLEINGSRYRFIVSGIIKTTGALAESNGSVRTIMPLKTLNSLYNVKGRVDRIYLKLLNPAKKQRLLYLLSRDYSRYSVGEPFTEWEIKRQTDRIATPVVIVTVILSFMCIYIIHTTFKIILFERLPVIGTFRSIGAEKRTTDLILLMESLLYGIVGGICGCCFGIGLLYFIAVMPETGLSAVVNIRLNITPVQLAATLGIAMLLSVAGSLISTVKTVRVSIRDIILGTTEKNSRSTASKALLGLILLCLSFIVPWVVPSRFALLVDTACMTTVLLSTSLLIPFAMERLLHFLKFCGGFLPGNIPQMAVMMLRNNRNAYSGVSMLVIGISSLYMISTLNWSQIRDTEVVFDRNRYEMTMSIPFADKTTLKLISEVDGVKEVLGNYSAGRTEVEDFDEPIWHIQGIQPVGFPTFQTLKTSGGQAELLKSLDKGRNILLSNALKSRIDVKAGDSLTIRFHSGNGGVVRRTYKITGFFDTIIKGMWSYALISEKNFKTDFRERFYNPVYIRTDKDPVEVTNNLKAAFSKRNPDILLKEEARKADLQSSGQLFFMLQGFTIMTLFTGLFGILNNLVIGFLQRKRQLAMLRTCGMSIKQQRQMIITESIIQGTSGSILGILAGLGTTWIIVPQIIEALDIESGIYFSTGITAICFISGVLAHALASAGILPGTEAQGILQTVRRE